jgi:hypothetical protein
LPELDVSDNVRFVRMPVALVLLVVSFVALVSVPGAGAATN